MMEEFYYSKLYKSKSSKLKHHVCLITYLSLCMNFLKHPFSRHPGVLVFYDI
ncbi:BnaA08g03550D [Brassica napus]|uniref:BnaA08g03550D protein n=1 Tax=Brassica napus TaxID=3708 RepID=A0A078HTF6_BRANA|nr:BnaA08g03550D [Brassica napus]